MLYNTILYYSCFKIYQLKFIYIYIDKKNKFNIYIYINFNDY